MKWRVVSTPVFCTLAAIALFPACAPAEPNQVKYVAPGVWFREGDFAQQGHCNNVIIEMKDYLVVVDANFPSGAAAVLADCKRISEKPVKYVFDTHHHGDHVYGNVVWTRNGATTMSFEGVVQEMVRLEPARWQAAAAQRPDVADLKLAAPEQPKEVLDRSPYVLKDATREIRFYHFGWAHTRGDGFVYLPKEKILCTGDAAVNGPYNYLGDANIANWPKALHLAQQLGPDIVLPGHGESGSRDILEGQSRFLTDLYKAVQAAFDKGKKIDEVATPSSGTGAAKVAGATTVKLPDAVKKWVGSGFADQVRDVYLEIAGKKPRGDLAQ